MAIKATRYRPRRSRLIRRRRKLKSKMTLTRPISAPTLIKRFSVRTQVYSNLSTTLTVSGNDNGFALGTPFLDPVAGYYGVGFSHFFKLSSLPNYTEFTNLFDRYKICKVVWTIMFQNNTAPMNGSSVLPILHVASDDDDANTPTALTELQQRSNCKRRVLGNTVMFKYTTRPKFASSVYNSNVPGFTTAYAVKSGYLNSDYYDAPHYGIKGMINNLYLTSGNSMSLTIEPVYYLALRDVK